MHIQGFYIAVCNITASYQYGARDSLLRKAWKEGCKAHPASDEELEEITNENCTHTLLPSYESGRAGSVVPKGKYGVEPPENVGTQSEPIKTVGMHPALECQVEESDVEMTSAEHSNSEEEDYILVVPENVRKLREKRRQIEAQLKASALSLYELYELYELEVFYQKCKLGLVRKPLGKTRRRRSGLNGKLNGYPALALADSASGSNVMTEAYASKHNLLIDKSPQNIKNVPMATGSLHIVGKVTGIKWTFEDEPDHAFTIIDFDVASKSSHDIILGNLFLQNTNLLTNTTID
jgi:hypothetical protein